MTIELSKTYKTRDGREVRIYAVDGGGVHPIHGAIKMDGGWSYSLWTASGSVHLDNYVSGSDLIEVKPRIRRKVWVNVNPHGVHGFATREYADYHANDNRIACVEIEIDVEEGHGL